MSREALILAQSALRRWTDLYAKLQNESGERVSRVLDYNLPPADHVKALEAIAEALSSEIAPTKADYDEAIIKRDALHLVVSVLAAKADVGNEKLIELLNHAEEELRAKRWLT